MKKIVFLYMAIILSLSGCGGSDDSANEPKVTSSSGLAIGSWNIKRLGHGDSRDYKTTAKIASSFDFLAIQEAMNEEGISTLVKEIEAQTNEDWSYHQSMDLGRSSYTETYVFLWRNNKVEYIDGEVVYLDPGDMFIREPYSARFKNKATGKEFIAATAHLIYGDTIQERKAEAEELANYWDWLVDTYNNPENIVLMGDFNLEPTDAAWGYLYSRNAQPLIESGLTTLSTIEGQYASLYDNFFVNGENSFVIAHKGIIAFNECFDLTNEVARDTVSDHAPVYFLTEDRVLKDSVTPCS